MRGIDKDRSPDDKRFVDVPFRQLMSDPIGTVEAIYRVAARQLSAEAEQPMCSWLAENRRGRHGVHEYSAVDFGIDVAERLQALRFYHERFNVPIDV